MVICSGTRMSSSETSTGSTAPQGHPKPKAPIASTSKTASSSKSTASKRASESEVLKIKRKTLSVVESLIEGACDVGQLLQGCHFMAQNDFDDLIEERAIIKYCGYPICGNVLKQEIKQQYKISMRTNRVYDLAKRKNFCSNQCFKAAQFLREQLSPEPVWLRWRDGVIIRHRNSYKLIDQGQTKENQLPRNEAIEGEEVRLTDSRPLKRKDIDRVSPTIAPVDHETGEPLTDTVAGATRNSPKPALAKTSAAYPYINEKQLGELHDQMKQLNIVEKSQPSHSSTMFNEVHYECDETLVEDVDEDEKEESDIDHQLNQLSLL